MSLSKYYQLFQTVVTSFIIALTIFLVSGVNVIVLGFSALLFTTVHHKLLSNIQNSFSSGEAAILSNAITLLTNIAWNYKPVDVEDVRSQNCIVLIGLILGSVLICFATFPFLHNTKSRNVLHNVCFYAGLLIVIFGIVSPWVIYLIGVHPVIWIWRDLAYLNNTFFVGYWIFCLVVFLPLIGYIQQFNIPTIIIRKIFHLLGLIMFVPATIVSPRFLAIGYAVVLAALLIIELIKFGNVPPCSAWLSQSMRRFVDSRDGGAFTVTHIYLLVGCATPLWLLSAIGLDNHLLASLPASYAGLMVLGVGDSFAAVVGSQYGRHKWGSLFSTRKKSSNNRSLEGSVAYTLSVLSTAVILGWFFEISVSWTRMFAAIVLSAVLEANTDQIDNIVLPVHFMALVNVALWT